MLRNIIRLVVERDAPIWPVISAGLDSSPTTFTSLDNALVASADDNIEQIRMLDRAGVSVICPSKHVRAVIVEYRPNHALSPQGAHEKLKVNSITS